MTLIEHGVGQEVPPIAAPDMKEHLALATHDLVRGLADWRMWLLLGMNDIRQRYRRSRIGQFWITISMAVTIGSLGVVYSYLFHTSIEGYLPFLAMGIIAWGLISSIVVDACTAFTTAESYLRQVPIPKSVFVLRLLTRNLVIFAHNVIIVPPLYFIFDVPLSWAILLAPVGLLLVAANGLWIGLLLGTVCTRFRDLPQIVNSLVQVVFFITPVMWKPDQLPPELGWLVGANPFADFLSLVREPLLGQLPAAESYWMAAGVTVAGFLLTLPLFARFRARIIYWL